MDTDRSDSPATTELLLEVLRDRTGRGDLAWARPPERITGGFWAEMFDVELVDPPDELSGRLVARVMPDAEIATLERVVQTWAFEHGIAVPRVRFAGNPDGTLGRAWMLMDHVPGAPILEGLSGPSAVAQLPRLFRGLPDLLAKAAVRLHAEPANELAATLAAQAPSRPVTPKAQLERVEQNASALGETNLSLVASRVALHKPPETRTVLCHGDLHPFNVLVDGDDVVLVDWSAATVGPPEFDLAFTGLMLANPPLIAPRPLAPPIRFAGRRIADRFLNQYRRLGGTIDAGMLAWSADLHALRILLDVAVWERQGTVSAHRGHPWLLLRPGLVERLRDRHRVTVVLGQ